MWWKLLVLVAMSGMIVFSFVTPAPQQQIGEASRIFYYHIPQAWVCVVAFAVSMTYSIRFLMKRRIEEDDKASVAAGLGLVFCILATVTGSVFAKVTWGSFWNWDPRETSIFILLLIYGAYFALRNALEDEDRRASLSAVYAIFAFATVPFLIFVVPRIVPSLHPTDSVVDKNLKIAMSPVVFGIFITSLSLFTILFFWMHSLGARVAKLTRTDMEGD